MAYLTDGFSADVMIDRVQGVIKGGTATADEAVAVQFLNMAQLEMFHRKDWPELRIYDDYITTDGSASYSLATALNDAAKAGFGRVVEKSVRYGSFYLEPITKKRYDLLDPGRTYGGTPQFYCASSRSDFRVLPYGSSGEKISLDWVCLPVEIVAATDAADISYAPEHHELIIEGAIWRACREFKPDREWVEMQRAWYTRLDEAYKNSRQFRMSSFNVQPHH